MTYKIGDRVRVAEGAWAGVNEPGTLAVITDVCGEGSDLTYDADLEDGENWLMYPDELIGEPENETAPAPEPVNEWWDVEVPLDKVPYDQLGLEVRIQVRRKQDV